MAPGDPEHAVAVVLTPGPYNSAYFEHSFLARTMGLELVQAPDLFVDGDRVFLKTTRGPRRVHVVYRRTDEGLIREDFEHVPMQVPAGRTTLLLRIPRTAPRNFGAYVRLLDENLTPQTGVTVRLPGVTLVIVIDLPAESDPSHAALSYVGMSRARAILIVLRLDETKRELS